MGKGKILEERRKGEDCGRANQLEKNWGDKKGELFEFMRKEEMEQNGRELEEVMRKVNQNKDGKLRNT